MSLVQLRSKRQLTVPINVADQLKLQPGDYLEASAEGHNRLVFEIKQIKNRESQKSVRDIIGAAPGVFTSIDDIDQYISDGRDES